MTCNPNREKAGPPNRVPSATRKGERKHFENKHYRFPGSAIREVCWRPRFGPDSGARNGTCNPNRVRLCNPNSAFSGPEKGSENIDETNTFIFQGRKTGESLFPPDGNLGRSWCIGPVSVHGDFWMFGGVAAVTEKLLLFHVLQ